MSSYLHILPEIGMSHRDAQSTATPFPATCPRCDAAKTFERNGAEIMEYTRTASYACGATYSHKSQIQNHTEYWWGTCPATKESHS